MYPYHRERHNPNQWNYTNGTMPPPYVKPVKAVKGIIRQIFYEAFHMFQIIIGKKILDIVTDKIATSQCHW
jgi:hypothetical protein